MGADAPDPVVELPLRPGRTAAGAAAAVLSDQAATVDAVLPACREGTDPEALHDLRVAVRRSRSVLRQLRKALPRRRVERHAVDLRWIQAVTGPTRDLDVLLARWDDLAAIAPEADRGDLETIGIRLRERRTAAFADLAGVLAGPDLAERWAAWKGFVAGVVDAPDRPGAADRPVEDLVARRIGSVAERFRRDGAAIGQEAPAGALHDLRKRGKELRYLMELFGGTCLPDGTVQDVIRRMKVLQDDLGRHQDDEVHRGLLASVAGGAPPAGAGTPARSGAALEAILGHLAADEAEARRRFEASFAAVTGAVAEAEAQLAGGRR